MLVNVLVEVKAKKIDRTFTYNVPRNLEEKVKIGVRVTVPFNNREVDGFVMSFNNDKIDFDVKSLISIKDDIAVLNEEMLKLGKYISKKTLSSLSSVYQAMLPKALNLGLKKDINIKTNTYYKIAKKDVKLTKKQEEFLEKFSYKSFSRSEGAKISVSIMDTLTKKGVLEKCEEEVYRLDNSTSRKYDKIIMNDDQEKAVDEVLDSKGFHPFLLHGVTGSGKTEVYIKVIKSVVDEGKEAILLLPEISLTPQIVDRFKWHFGNRIAILHSRLSNGEKYDEWRKILRGEVKIVIGARSAIFAPFTNLGVIIIDEEHSTTYKQENNPKYHAIDVAINRCKRYKCPLVLGTATPSIESYTRAELGIYGLINLKERVNKNLPKIKLVSMLDELKKGNKIFSELLLLKIREKLDKNEQVILFLNRRGYSTVLTCDDCGTIFKCPNCDIPLTHHKFTNQLRCHYCDYKKNHFKHCDSCNSTNISSHGLGTEKVEAEINKIFKDAKTIRMDLDTTSKKGSHEKIINDFGDGKYNILIGTQMISKGLDFERVSLVGVLNADSSLNIPDFRSGERTFQLLSQVAGRAGRSDIAGEVIIQSFDLDHYSIKYAITNDYNSFYNKEIQLRKQLNYPPFYDLVLVKIKGPEFSKCYDEGLKIKEFLLGDNLIVLGPSSALLPKIRNIYNLQILIKVKNTKQVSEKLDKLLKLYPKNKVTIDVDLFPIRV